MTSSQISSLRFFNQHIQRDELTTPQQLVEWLGAVQAQDYAMAKWAVGVRLKNLNTNMIEEAINNGEVIRTHVLRPTWHFVSPRDVRWMMELTRDNINRATVGMNKQLQLDEKIFSKSNRLIEKLLSDGKHLTRKEIMEVLEKKGIQTNELRASHLMFRAETEMIVCNGNRIGKQFTYALFDSRVPHSKKLIREEALAELTKRYFQSHGPATLQDFTWWSGLTTGDAKKGLEGIRKNLLSQKLKDDTFWFYETALAKPYNKMVFLPAYDEFLISYKSRHISLDPQFASKSFTTNGIFNPIIVQKAKVLGIWKPQLKKQVHINEQFFARPTETQKYSCKTAAKQYGKFIEMKVYEG